MWMYGWMYVIYIWVYVRFHFGLTMILCVAILLFLELLFLLRFFRLFLAIFFSFACFHVGFFSSLLEPPYSDLCDSRIRQVQENQYMLAVVLLFLVAFLFVTNRTRAKSRHQ